MASHASPSSGSPGEAKKSGNSFTWDIALWIAISLSVLGFLGYHFDIWGDSDTRVANTEATVARSSERERKLEENLLCPGIPNPVPEWTDYVAPANTGSPDDWEGSEVISMPACSNASLRSSDDPSTRLVQCKRRGRWPADGQPSQRSECDNVTAVRYLSASSESVLFQYKFVRRK